MINRGIFLLSSFFVLLLLSTCQPQIASNQAKQDNDTSTFPVVEPATQTELPSSTRRAAISISSTPFSTVPLTTFKPLQEESLAVPTEPIEEMAAIMEPTMTSSSNPAIEKRIAQAKEDLAQRLGITADNIDVVAVVGQGFPADAFYCRTGKGQIARDESPAVIVGETILLQAAGFRYEYHASDQSVIFCRRLR